MRLLTSKDQRGIAHVVEIVIIGVIVLGVAGFIVWRMMSSQPAANTTNNSQQTPQSANCTYDQDVCKFLSSFKAMASFKVTNTTVTEGQTTTSVYEVADGGKKYHMVFPIDGANYEVIGIDDTTYTRAADGTWWRQTTKPDAENPNNPADLKYDIDNLDIDDTSDGATYEKVGMEACGSLQCFKYKVVDASSPDPQYIWFDTQDYKLQRFRTEGPTGDVNDQTFDYAAVTINVPTPVKDLAPNQYLVPGQNEPMTLPDPSDYNM